MRRKETVRARACIADCRHGVPQCKHICRASAFGAAESSLNARAPERELGRMAAMVAVTISLLVALTGSSVEVKTV